MAVAAVKPQKTYRDFARLPEGTRAQLIGGEIIMSPAPRSFHQEIIMNIAYALRNFVRKNRLGKVYISPIDIHLSDTEGYQPDVIFVAKDRLEIVTEKDIAGAPDMVFEVLSVSTAYYDLTHKKKVYEDFGVKEYWITDPQELTVEVFTLKGESFSSAFSLRETGEADSLLLSGFSLPLDVIFDRGI